MNQNVRESFSALMDNEGDELEVRRVLKALQSSPEEADTWRRYHLARSLLQRDRGVDVTADLSAGIMARLADEPVPQDASATSRRGAPFSFAGSAAVAAAVSLMVITGVQVYNANVPGGRGGAEFAGGDSDSGSGLAGNAVSPVSLTGGASATTVNMGDAGRGFLASPAGTGPVFPNLAPSAPGGLMEAGMESPLFADPDHQSSRRGYQYQRSDYEQVLMLQAYLNQRLDGGVGNGTADAWMSSRDASSDPDTPEKASQR